MKKTLIVKGMLLCLTIFLHGCSQDTPRDAYRRTIKAYSHLDSNEILKNTYGSQSQRQFTASLMDIVAAESEYQQAFDKKFGTKTHVETDKLLDDVDDIDENLLGNAKVRINGDFATLEMPDNSDIFHFKRFDGIWKMRAFDLFPEKNTESLKDVPLSREIVMYRASAVYSGLAKGLREIARRIDRGELDEADVELERTKMIFSVPFGSEGYKYDIEAAEYFKKNGQPPLYCLIYPLNGLNYSELRKNEIIRQRSPALTIFDNKLIWQEPKKSAREITPEKLEELLKAEHFIRRLYDGRLVIVNDQATPEKKYLPAEKPSKSATQKKDGEEENDNEPEKKLNPNSLYYQALMAIYNGGGIAYAIDEDYRLPEKLYYIGWGDGVRDIVVPPSILWEEGKPEPKVQKPVVRTRVEFVVRFENDDIRKRFGEGKEPLEVWGKLEGVKAGNGKGLYRIFKPIKFSSGILDPEDENIVVLDFEFDEKREADVRRILEKAIYPLIVKIPAGDEEEIIAPICPIDEKTLGLCKSKKKSGVRKSKK